MKICAEYAALLDPFVDGELTAEETLRVQAHLDGCPACRAYVDDALAIRAAFPDVEDTEVPEGFAEAVSAAIRAGAAPRKRKPWTKTLLPLAACCAIVILLVKTPIAIHNTESNLSSAIAPQSSEGAVPENDAALEEAEYDLASAANLPLENGIQEYADLPEVALDSAADNSGDTENRERGITYAGSTADAASVPPEAPSEAGTPAESAPEIPQSPGEAAKNGEVRDVQPEVQSEESPSLQVTSALPVTAWIPVSQKELLSGYVTDTDENGVSFWLLTGEEYGVLLEALAERGASVTPDSPTETDVGLSVQVYLREE